MSVNAGLVALMGPQLGVLLPVLDEKSGRLALGAVARAAGVGGIGAVAKVTGASWQAVEGAAAEEASRPVDAGGPGRRPGRSPAEFADRDPGLVPALVALVEDSSRGDPESPLAWAARSARKLSGELAAQGHACSPQTAWRLLHGPGFSTRANAKVTEGRRHPDRDAQFRYVAAQAREHLAAGQPVISVDARKKEQVGDYARAGREWRPRGEPVRVRDHGFEDEQGGHAIPYGISDAGAGTGFVNVGTDHNTAALAVESIGRWRTLTGKDACPAAGRLLACCDAGGSSGWRNRAWEAGLTGLARETGPEITCCHFPPGTPKWDKIGHRLFSQITLAWRGRPLTSHDVIINCIGARHHGGRAELHRRTDENRYRAVHADQPRADDRPRTALVNPAPLPRRLELHPAPGSRHAVPAAGPAGAHPGRRRSGRPGPRHGRPGQPRADRTVPPGPRRPGRQPGTIPRRRPRAAPPPRTRPLPPSPHRTAAPFRYPLETQLPAAICHHRPGMPYTRIAALTGARYSTIIPASRATASHSSRRPAKPGSTGAMSR